VDEDLQVIVAAIKGSGLFEELRVLMCGVPAHCTSGEMSNKTLKGH
jgi:hypothetical protein